MTFELEMIAGCDMTAFADWHLKAAAPIQASVLADSTRIELGPVQDTVSRQNGNNDGLTHCGERVFKIVDQGQLPGFITFD